MDTLQLQPYNEYLIPYRGARIYVRHYAGTGPAFVLMHGFPDNLHIYDRLIPLLHGHQIISFDFLGWGASDKPEHYPYTSQQQEQELQAVLNALDIEQVIPVAHDSSGPVAINWSLNHPQRVSALFLLNTYYADTTNLHFPEFIRLFADPTYAALTQAITSDLTTAQWLLTWQGSQFARGGQARESLLPMIWPQFAEMPSTFPPLIHLTRNLSTTLKANTQHLSELKSFERPVRIIFGADDPYLKPEVAQNLHALFPTSDLFLLPKGHWPQLEGASEVAQLFLSLPAVSSIS